MRIWQKVIKHTINSYICTTAMSFHRVVYCKSSLRQGRLHLAFTEIYKKSWMSVNNKQKCFLLLNTSYSTVKYSQALVKSSWTQIPADRYSQNAWERMYIQYGGKKEAFLRNFTGFCCRFGGLSVVRKKRRKSSRINRIVLSCPNNLRLLLIGLKSVEFCYFP